MIYVKDALLSWQDVFLGSNLTAAVIAPRAKLVLGSGGTTTSPVRSLPSKWKFDQESHYLPEVTFHPTLGVTPKRRQAVMSENSNK